MVDILEESLTFWNELNKDEKSLMIQAVKTQYYAKGTIMSRTDAECKGLMIIKKGQIRSYIISEDGREVTIYRLNEGEVCVLSASCLMDSIEFDVMIEAMEDTQVILIPSNVMAMLKQNKSVELFLYKSATEKFSEVMWTMQQILFFGVDKRVAIFLWDEFTKNDSKVISYTHDEIAKLIGSAREVVSKMLKYFAQEGIILLGRGKIELIDKKKLNSYIQ